MYPISNAVKALFEAEQTKVLRITGTDSNNTSISITDDDVIVDSFNVDRYCCNGEKLEIGTAVAAEMSMRLENGDGRYDSIVFEGTELFVEVGIADWSQANPTVTYIPCGYFTPDVQPRKLTTISIKALDRMTRFDAVPPTLTSWTDENGSNIQDENGNTLYFVSDLSFPCTVAQLVKQVAVRCNVPFTQSLSSLPNYNYTITSLPTLQQDITFRDIIQWCAGIMGTCAFIDWNGYLQFKWYSAASYTSTLSNRYTSDLYENDIKVTGVQYTNVQNVTIVSGTDNYALDMTGNYLAQSGISTILPNVKNKVNNFTYRPFSASVIAAPYLWPLDVITFVDKNNVSHSCAVTNVNFSLNGNTALIGKGETSQLNSGTKPSGVTKEQGLLIEQAAEATRQLDNSLTQEEIFNRLTDNGETQGLILYNGKVYLNASYISTGTLAADYIKGGMLTLGGNGNTNGEMRVLDANGNVIGTWNNAGITLNKGTIAGPSMTLGGSSNTNGTLTVKDASNSTIGTWDKDGISVSSGSITGGTINGASLTLGGLNNTSGTLTVKNYAGTIIGTWDNSGITLYKGTIQGPSMTLGGSGNANGALTVKDANDNTIGYWGNTGITLNKGTIQGPSMTVGGVGNANGTLTVKDANNNTIGTWDNTGISIKSGEIELRNSSDSTLGLNIGPYGDIAVGTKPSDLSSFANNKCPFQINNWGTVKMNRLRMYGRANDSSNFSLYGYIDAYPQDSNLDVSNGIIFKNSSGGQMMHVGTSETKFWNGVNVATTLKAFSLNVTGTKSRVVSTDQYSDRLLYCYETPSPTFGDVGEGVISEDGLCYVTLDAVFAQTISTAQYQVFLQKYGDGDCWVKERKGAYYVVQGTPGLSFGWEIKAKQADFDQLRLERNDEKFKAPDHTYGEDAANYIDTLKKGRISA